MIRASIVALACCGLFLVAMVLLTSGDRDQEQAARAIALAADSAQASQDSTRVEGIAAGRDSVRLFQRRIVQIAQRADSLDRALGMERAARYRIAAEVTELRTRIAAAVTEEGEGDRSAQFRGRDGPFNIDAAVTLPRPPGDGRMTLRVALDTAVLEARIGCGPPDAAGVRPAMLSLAGPAWMNARLARLEQEPRVCSPGELEEQMGREPLRVRLARRLRLGVGYGAVIAPDGRVIRGPAVTAMWTLWP